MLTRESLAHRIAEERQRAGLTQKELAERLGIDRTTVTRIENGQQGVDTLQLSAIAEALARPPAVFFDTHADQSTALFRRTAGAEDRELRKHEKWLESFVSDYQFLRTLAGSR